MQPRSAPADQARALFADLDTRMDTDPLLARRVVEALRKAGGLPRSSNRRAPAILDPASLYRRDPTALRPALQDLTLDQLKDIVSQYAMDPRRLALKWKTPDRLVDLIINVTEQRASKGNAFRT
jgi:hypothetical protein